MDGLPPPNVVDTDFFGIWIEGDCSSEHFDALFFDFGQKLSDWRNFQKNFRSPLIFRYIPVFHHLKLFFEIASIAQFLSDIKKEGIKLFGRAIPFYPDTKIIGIHHIRGGSPSIFISTIF